jgi:hypothetical protein
VSVPSSKPAVGPSVALSFELSGQIYSPWGLFNTSPAFIVHVAVLRPTPTNGNFELFAHCHRGDLVKAQSAGLLKLRPAPFCVECVP